MDFIKKLATEIYHLIRIVVFTILTLPRDISGAIIFKKIKTKLRYIDTQNISVSDYYLQWVSKQPNKPLILYNDIVWTFKDVILNK